MDENVGDPNHPYAGKRGRHPADCNCPIHAAKREATQSHPNGAPSVPPSDPPPEPPSNSESGGAPPSLEAILNEGEVQPNIVPQDTDKKPGQTGTVTTQKPKRVYVSPKLLKFVGNKLANVTGVDGYRLTDEEAKDIAEVTQEMAAHKGWGFTADMNFYLAIGIWLIIPTLEFAAKKWKERKEEKEKKEKLKTGPFNVPPNEVTDVPPSG